MKKVLVPLAPGFEEMEAVCVVDVLRRAGAEVTTAGTQPGPIQASRRVVVLPDTTLDQVDPDEFDMIVIPGGAKGVDVLKADPIVKLILQKMNGQGKYVTAICAGPIVLAEAGLLKGRAVTSYPGVGGLLEGAHLKSDRVVVDGKIVTSQGPGTAIEFALKLAEILQGKARAEEVAKACLART